MTELEQKRCRTLMDQAGLAVKEKDWSLANELMDKIDSITGEGRSFGSAEERYEQINEWASQPNHGPTDTEFEKRSMVPSYQTVKEERELHRRFGEFLQATARAATPFGGTIGGKPTGVVDEALTQAQEKEISFFREQRAITGLGESQPSEGGFLTSAEVSDEIFRRVYENDIVFQGARKYEVPANRNAIEIPAVDETSRTDGNRPVRGFWVDEGAAMTASKPNFRKMTLTPNKLTCLVYATDELLQDSVNLGQFVMQVAAEEIAYKTQDAYVNGDGSGKPSGILSADCLISVTKETNQTATTLVYENAMKAWSRMWGPSRLRAIWLANADCIPQLYAMSLAVGTSGAPVFLPSGGAAQRPFDTLFGRPLRFIEQAKTLGTVGDLILADLSQYLIAYKSGIQSAMSIHVNFTQNESVFRFIYRLDAQPAWAAALTPAQGTNTQSPFVAIATRS